MIVREVETYRWLPGKVRGYIVTDDDSKDLPGMFTINFADVDGSINRELDRWFMDYSYYKLDPSKPDVEYTTSISKAQAFRPAREDRVTHGGSWLSRLRPAGAQCYLEPHEVSSAVLSRKIEAALRACIQQSCNAA